MSDDVIETTMPGMPVRLTTPDTTDRRLIAEMRFGVNYSPAEVLRDAKGNILSKDWVPTLAQQQEEAWVRSYLKACGCVVASDIEALGCTGVASHEATITCDSSTYRLAIDHGTRLRLGLGGGGVGLVCFVPSDRFCLVHNTVGGLQDRQKQQHAEFVALISRELTPAERVSVGLMKKAIRMRGGERTIEAMDVLAGQNQEALDAVVSGLEDAHDEKVLDAAAAEDDDGSVPFVRLGTQLWKCGEHTKTDWSCRHCLAQAIVEGALIPSYVFRVDTGAADRVLTPFELEETLEKSEVDAAFVYVLAATFSRKLSRD